MAIACQNCHQAPATVHITDVIPPHGEKRERHLCDACAETEGVTMKQHEPINNILAKFVQQQAGSGIKEAADRTCPKCGISFREFRAQGLLGCPHDYVAFSKHLTPLIERAHGAGGEHVGKRPRRAGGSAGKQSTLRQLHRKLSDAVEREDYEAAAKLRDQIKVLEANAD